MRMCTCACALMHIHVCTCILYIVHLYQCMYTPMHACTRLCMHVSMQVRLGERLGLHWVEAGTGSDGAPSGHQVETEALAKALGEQLSHKVAFSRAELDAFRVDDLRHNSYVKALGHDKTVKYYIIDMEG